MNKKIDTTDHTWQTNKIEPNAYYQKRIKELKIKEEKHNFLCTPSYRGKYGKSEIANYHNYNFFQPCESGIQINYFQPLGYPYTWLPPGAKWHKSFTRIRLEKPNVIKKGDKTDTQKYYQPKGSGQQPFFTPRIIEAFREEKEIDTLFFTEGEFKAFKGDMAGLHIIGLPSIHGFYGAETRGMLHEDIQEVIIKCRVKKVLFITDADTLTITYDKKKDLYKRQFAFYTAIKNWRESLQLLLDDNSTCLEQIYFSHIKTKYKDSAKGLDDLLLAFPEYVKDILEDLNQFQFAKKYFSGQNITDPRNKLYGYFGLSNETEFYNLYREFIGNREFLFKSRRYEWNGESVKYVKHEDADKYMRIASDWYKTIAAPNKNDELEESIEPWKIGEIQRDYKRFPDFIDQIPKYDAFCNVPNWNGEYRRVHNNCYNLTNPLPHIPMEGTIENSKKFFKHIFGGKSDFDNPILGDQFTVALDYMSILLQKPKRMLPVPILVSKEQGTGKSTFFKWVQQMFGGENVAILNNELFKMKFNAHYITKFIIAIDEGFLDLDKKTEKERLKQLATADTQYLENKGVNLKKFPYYGKLMIGSNDADKVMKIEEEDSRWFVVKVSKIEDKDKDPHLEKKLNDEIPAWIHFLKTREIFHPDEDRLWFYKERFITDQFRLILEKTKNRFEKVIEDYIKELFLTYKMKEILMPRDYLINKLNESAKYKIDAFELKEYLKDKKKLTPEKKSMRSQIPIGFKEDTFEVEYYRKTCKPYRLKPEDWLNDEEMIEYLLEDDKDTGKDGMPF
ncbi:primase-helicase family protein [Flexithrix dorotheae]|uniref:primase-helicase family protein n=1 Tax=Flexithrix dorotheae TaxID=70993 RepID=UPI00036B4D0B|nr:DUF5906 domain-containing protein [Flexithrix dorotheae]